MIDGLLQLYKSVKYRRGLNRDKIDLIDFSFSSLGLRSFADLGGVWRVEGGYTFYAINLFEPDSAVLVDTTPTRAVMQKISQYRQLQFVHGNFGEQQTATRVGQVDSILLFDVLLHQVSPNWDQVLDMYSAQTRCFIVYNQQWVKSATTIRLLDLGEDEYFQNVPHSRIESPYDNLFQKLDDEHPEHKRKWRDVHNIWQWGITDQALGEKMKALGFRMQYYKNCGQFGNLKNFQNHAFVFSR